jgi:hypothetical protein
MDGATLTHMVNSLLAEDSTSVYIDNYLTYHFLWKSATEFAKETGSLTSTVAITTTAAGLPYQLPADFLSLYMMNDTNEYFIKVYDGSGTYFITYRDADAMYLGNQTATALPSNFNITDYSAPSIMSSAATDDGAVVNGECTLTDAGATFTSLSAGDTVHNITDGSKGIVIAVTSATAVVTALFGGTLSSWTSGDLYKIIPSARKSLVLDPPSSVAGYIITVPYIQRPDPVFSPYRAYKINDMYTDTIAKYAAWLYKYRDMQPSLGDPWYAQWDREVRKAKSTERKVRNRYNFKVNFTKRALNDKSYR